jgi:aconitate hydratase
VKLVEAYTKAQGLFREQGMPDPIYSDTLELDLSTVVPSLAGPKRPQDRIALTGVKANYEASLKAHNETMAQTAASKGQPAPVSTPQHLAHRDREFDLIDGAVVIAAITSCTNTSNPSVMLAAGLVAQKAVAKGLTSKPWVKTSLAPGSKVAKDYFEKAGVQSSLDALGFQIAGYGCTTCIGNSGPLPEVISKGIDDGKLTVAAVLSGNRNFEGRVNPQTRFNYLASPPLVVAYALAGRMDIDFELEAIGTGTDGQPVFLRDIWPSSKEVEDVVLSSVKREYFEKQYADVFGGDEQWKAIPVPTGSRYTWDDKSTYVKHPPYFEGMTMTPPGVQQIANARVLGMFADSITTDHISPAGSIAEKSPAGVWLKSLGVEKKDFNSYGARRGNHEVMMRGTFANIRLKNELTPGLEGWWTRTAEGAEPTSFFDASESYKKSGTPLVIIAGKEYGTGSSRDWAAKGTMLLGVRAVIAESFERIHRSNLVGMGVIPCEFTNGETRQSLGLTGFEHITIEGMSETMSPRAALTVHAVAPDGTKKSFAVRSRIDTPEELNYFRNGGILPYVLRNLARA